jgi:hypothetical protein
LPTNLRKKNPMYMAVALLVWVAWIIKKYEVRSRRYENTFHAYLSIMSLRFYRGDFFCPYNKGKIAYHSIILYIGSIILTHEKVVVLTI